MYFLLLFFLLQKDGDLSEYIFHNIYQSRKKEFKTYKNAMLNV